MALFLRQVSRSCWKNREDDRLPSGIRAPLFFSLFLFFLSVAPVTQSSSPLLKRFGKNSNFFSFGKLVVSNSLFRLIFPYDFNSDNMK